MTLEHLFNQLEQAVNKKVAFVGIQKHQGRDTPLPNAFPMVVITFPGEVSLFAAKKFYQEISDNYREVGVRFVNFEEYPIVTIRIFVNYISPEIREKFQVITQNGVHAWFS